MSVRIPEKSLVVVADGHRAVLFRVEGKGDALSLREERALTPQNLADESASGVSPVEQSPREQDEATFAKQVMQALYRMKHAGQYDGLVLFADPQTLGQMRQSMHKIVEDSLIDSAAKSLTNQSGDDIAEAVRRL